MPSGGKGGQAGRPTWGCCRCEPGAEEEEHEEAHFPGFAVAVLCPCVALAASVLDSIPVYGAACVAVEDADLLKDTILGLGVLAVTPGEVHRVFIGDGLTPGARVTSVTGNRGSSVGMPVDIGSSVAYGAPVIGGIVVGTVCPVMRPKFTVPPVYPRWLPVLEVTKE